MNFPILYYFQKYHLLKLIHNNSHFPKMDDNDKKIQKVESSHYVLLMISIWILFQTTEYLSCLDISKIIKPIYFLQIIAPDLP